MLVSACGVSRPSRVERSTINFVKHRIAVGGARRTNPFPATPENLRDGRQAFSHYCITCHGLDGQGTRADVAADAVAGVAGRAVVYRRATEVGHREQAGLPIRPDLSVEAIDYVCDRIREFFACRASAA
jgi:mono/diheme cytochrome c family protein